MKQQMEQKLSKAIENYQILQTSFYLRKTPKVAKDLLGKIIVRKLEKNKYIYGIISEVEAYLPYNDPAAHSYKGKTKRTSILFEKPGLTYIYRIHQSHCINISCEKEGIPGCALIRGIIQINENGAIEETVSGPGKVTKKLGLTVNEYGLDTTNEHEMINIIKGINPKEIETSKRVGISKAIDLPLRFIAQF